MFTSQRVQKERKKKERPKRNNNLDAHTSWPLLSNIYQSIICIHFNSYRMFGVFIDAVHMAVILFYAEATIA
jgi:hypothetical protein